MYCAHLLRCISVSSEVFIACLVCTCFSIYLLAVSSTPRVTEESSAEIELVAWPVLEPNSKWAALAIARPTAGGGLHQLDLLILPLKQDDEKPVGQVEKQAGETSQVWVELPENHQQHTQQQEQWPDQRPDQWQQGGLGSAMNCQEDALHQFDQSLHQQQQNQEQDVQQHQWQLQREQQGKFRRRQERKSIIAAANVGLLHNSQCFELVTEQQPSRGTSKNMLLIQGVVASMAAGQLAGMVYEGSLFVVKAAGSANGGTGEMRKGRPWWCKGAVAATEAARSSYSCGSVRLQVFGKDPGADVLVPRPGGDMFLMPERSGLLPGENICVVPEELEAGGSSYKAQVFSATGRKPLCCLDPLTSGTQAALIWRDAR